MGYAKHDTSNLDVHTNEQIESPALYLIVTMADTTWRMFIPTIGLLLLGSMADDYWHISPWLLLSGFVAGCGISTVLVRRQLAKGKRS